QADPDLRKYIADGCLVIARRVRNDQFVELIELRDSFRPRGSMNVGFDGDPRPFLLDDDLTDLQKFASSIPYDLNEVSGYYTSSIRNLTHDRAFLALLGADADRICQAILKRIQEQQ